MKDAQVRGFILQKLYAIRHERGYLRLPDELDLPGFDMRDKQTLKMLGNVGKQLADKGLIDFAPVIGPFWMGRASISASGVDVVEGNLSPPIAIIIDQSINVHDSSHVQIGTGHTQNMKTDK